MPSRANFVNHIASFVGPTLRVEDTRDGWPAFAAIEVDDPLISAAIYVGEVHGTHRGNPAERRFQNPGRDRAILEYPNWLTVLVGLWADDEDVPVPTPVLILPEPERRLGRVTRWSMFSAGYYKARSHARQSGRGRVVPRCTSPSNRVDLLKV